MVGVVPFREHRFMRYEKLCARDRNMKMMLNWIEYRDQINAHTDAAIREGATREEIVDAPGVDITVNAGAAMVYSARTIDAFDTKTQK
jgi:alkylhydroperoxidase/carboxymuconolactone decarboxylase family protein YurZ